MIASSSFGSNTSSAKKNLFLPFNENLNDHIFPFLPPSFNLDHHPLLSLSASQTDSYPELSLLIFIPCRNPVSLTYLFLLHRSHLVIQSHVPFCLFTLKVSLNFFFVGSLDKLLKFPSPIFFFFLVLQLLCTR